MTDLTKECWWCGKQPAKAVLFDPYWRQNVRACKEHVDELRESVRHSRKAMEHQEGYAQ